MLAQRLLSQALSQQKETDMNVLLAAAYLIIALS